MSHHEYKPYCLSPAPALSAFGRGLLYPTNKMDASNAEVRSGTKGLYSFFLSENPTWGFATLWLLHVGVSDLDSERVRNCDAYTMMS